MSSPAPTEQILLVHNNNIIERVVQTSIGKGQSFAYRPQEPQQIEYGMQEEHLQLQEDSDGGGSTSSGAGGDRVFAEEDVMQQSGGKSPSSGGQKRGGMMDDKKMRRQIANSNERRRMQSINAGFQSLRNQLPHHEGEKLSKAAILQQTSEYIYSLEQERTQLLSQNCYLKRLLAQHDVQDLQQSEMLSTIGTSPSAAGSAVALVPSSSTIMVPTTTSSSSSSSTQGPASKNGAGGKKRKMDPVTTIQTTTVSDSSDEGLGSMSPEPFTLVLQNGGAGGKTTKKQQAAALAAAELKAQQQTQQAVADLERIQRTEEEYTITEIVEPCMDFEIDIDSAAIEETVVSSERSVPVVSAAPLPKKKRITVESAVGEASLPAGALLGDHQLADGTRVTLVNTKTIFRDLSDMHSGPQEIQELQLVNCDNEVVLCSTFPGDSSSIVYESSAGDERKPMTIIRKLGIIEGGTLKEVVTTSTEKKSKLQPLLESFNKVENKVEVERITNSPVTMTVVKEEPGARGFLGASTSRQNLETIVEAIRHLEGDRFGEQPKNGRNGVVVKTEALQSLVAELPTQEVPLALTTKAKEVVAATAAQRAELSQFVHFKTKQVAAAAVAGGAAAGSGAAKGGSSTSSSSSSGANPKLTTTTVVLHQLQQCRPGVIVAKQSS